MIKKEKSVSVEEIMWTDALERWKEAEKYYEREHPSPFDVAIQEKDYIRATCIKDELMCIRGLSLQCEQDPTTGGVVVGLSGVDSISGERVMIMRQLFPSGSSRVATAIPSVPVLGRLVLPKPK